MTPSATDQPGTRPTRTAPKPTGAPAARVAGYGFAVSWLYVAVLVTIDQTVGWQNDVITFLGCLPPSLFLLSPAAGCAVLAVRARRASARFAAGLAASLFGFAALFAGFVLWTLTTTDWLVW